MRREIETDQDELFEMLPLSDYQYFSFKSKMSICTMSVSGSGCRVWGGRE